MKLMVIFFLWLLAFGWAAFGLGWILGGAVHWSPPLWLSCGPLGFLAASAVLRALLHGGNSKGETGR
jgi:hypothetical protein